MCGSACTGCTETPLRTNHPTLETPILDTISLDDNETLSAGAGHQAENWKPQGMMANWGKRIIGPNPSGAAGPKDVIKDKPVVTVPGCPPNPYNFLSLWQPRC